MELHTLGVDGGYTQKDVTEVARAFTGWTIENPRQGGGFTFNPRLHDTGQKVVLGHVIKAGGGESDGEQVLDILAKQPATARFIATKLARRFVSDTPPPALVDRAAARFRATRRRLARGDADDSDVAGIPRARGVPRQGQDAVRVRRQRRAGTRRRRAGRAAARPSAAAARDAALSVPAADRLQGHRGRVGQHRRAGQPHELRADAGRQQAARRVGGVAADRGRRSLAGDLSETTRATIAKASDAATDGRADPRVRAGISTDGD